MQLIKLVEDRRYIYLYVSSQSAYMVDKASIKGGTVDEFKTYLADKTKLKWTRPVSLLTFGIKDIIKRDDSFQGPRLG